MADSYSYPWSPKRGRYMYSLPWEEEGGAGRRGVGCLPGRKIIPCAASRLLCKMGFLPQHCRLWEGGGGSLREGRCGRINELLTNDYLF